MDRGEIPISDIRGGTGNNYLLKRQLLDHIINALDIASYKQLPQQTSSQAVHRSYLDNETFWKDAITDRQFESMKVQLESFHITEWIPLTPGRYFTSSARKNRQIAEQWYDPVKREYALDGKTAMFLGGIGSVRFTAKTIASETTYFLGASSSGVSHQGIPLALHQPEYDQVIQIIKDHGGCFANIVGTLRELPVLFSLARHDRQVPKRCLVVDDIEIIQPSSSLQLSATISATFRLDERTLKNAWTFNTFHPGSSDNTLWMAVDRLQTYIKHYSHRVESIILSDFDEQYSHFANDVELPISNMFSGDINTNLISQYETYLGVKIYGDIIDARGSQVFFHAHGNQEVIMKDKVEGDKPTVTNTTHIGSVTGQVHTGEGDINVGSFYASSRGVVSTKDEFLSALREFMAEVDASRKKGLPEETAEDTITEVEAAIREAKKDSPKLNRVIERLNNAKSIMVAGTGVITAAGQLIPLIEGAIQSAGKIFM